MAYVPPARSTVAVVGLGSIGGIVVGCLRDADRHDVIVCTRKPIERLVLERPEGVVDVSLHALHDPARAQRVDWVLLCTKGHQTPSATPWLRRLCDSATRVAVLQNGIGHIARISPLVGGCGGPSGHRLLQRRADRSRSRSASPRRRARSRGG
jgi:2-dehydropantoate 2-reductase